MTTATAHARKHRQHHYIARLTTKNLMLAIESATRSHGKLNVKENQTRSLENIQDLQAELFSRLRAVL